MNKRSIVIAVAVAALMVFGLGAFAYKNGLNNKSEAQSQTSSSATENSTLIRPHSPIIGPKNAPVTIVEFFDPSCEACRAFYPTVKKIHEKYPNDVRVILRYAAFHQGSDEAVRILEAAKKQDLYVPVLEALLSKQPEWAIHGRPDLEKAWNFAGEAGLDIAKARKDGSDSKIVDLLKLDSADIQTNNVQGTPTFFINGVRLQSFGHQQLMDAVDAAVAKSSATNP